MIVKPIKKIISLPLLALLASLSSYISYRYGPDDNDHANAYRAACNIFMMLLFLNIAIIQVDREPKRPYLALIAAFCAGLVFNGALDCLLYYLK